jgi:DNA-binding PadR family transcriptional regulator
MKFDDVLLALIARRARSGYDLKKWLDVEGIFIRANADSSQIYRTLRRLRQQGLIVHEVVRKSGPDAKVYRVTDDGMAHLRALAATPFEPPARWSEPDFSARISLLGPIEPSSIVPTYDREIAFREAQIRRFRNRPRLDDFEPGVAGLDAELRRVLMHEADLNGQRGMDRWLEWLREQRSMWAGRLGQPAADSEDSASIT